MTQLGTQKNAKSWCRGQRARCAIAHPSHVISRTLSRDYHFHAEAASHCRGSFANGRCHQVLRPEETRIRSQYRRVLSVPELDTSNSRDSWGCPTTVPGPERKKCCRLPPWVAYTAIGLRTSRRKSPQGITALGRTPPVLLLALTEGFRQPLHELISLPQRVPTPALKLFQNCDSFSDRYLFETVISGREGHALSNR
jgi:hypothetical protein